ncbi:MAG TPA: Sua5/YciO/YrdC/YwlC family protein [Planctomycetaceae bacterium]|jgi:protein-tyrosine phosphatase|nr:Sua5/YciO/YrdC/YwlC family protein [Planctomycetaceae bacterium]
MSAVVDLRKTDDPRDAVHRAVQLLVAGHLVGFPTETVYEACAHALVGSAVERLSARKSRGQSAHPTLVVKGLHEALDYVPHMDALGQRLARRCWPGPVTLAFDIKPETGLLSALVPESQRALSPDSKLWIRVPAHECIQEALRLMPAPLIAGSDCLEEPRLTAASLLDGFGSSIELIIDDGECRYGQPATVVGVSNGAWSIVRPGVVTETMIGRLASEVFLFICTGNTCRSPLAEGLFRKMLADRLKCREDELADHGYMVVSAGITAEPGLPAAPESITVAARYGVDLRSHESQRVTQRLLEQADQIFTMTRGHRESILASFPHLGDRIELLARDGTEIPDPIGLGEEEYEQCRAAIDRNLKMILSTLPLPGGKL